MENMSTTKSKVLRRDGIALFLYACALWRFVKVHLLSQGLFRGRFSVKFQGAAAAVIRPPDQTQKTKTQKESKLHPKSFAITICFEAAEACVLVCLSEAVNT